MIPIDLYFQGLESAKKRSGGTWRIQSMCQSQWKWVSHTVFTCFYPVGNNNFLHNIGDIWWYLWDNRCKYYLDTETRPQVSKGWILQTILTKTKPPKGGFTHFMALGSAHSCLWMWQQKWHERVQPGFMDPKKYWPWITAMALQIKELGFR